MADTVKNKVMMTVSIDRETRQLIGRYARQRAIGQLISKLVRKHDYEMHYGRSKIETRLARIEERLLDLVERSSQAMPAISTTREG
jgi:hypothetical protein